MGLESKIRAYANLNDGSTPSVISKEIITETFVEGKILNINELARKVNVSQSAISKYVKKIGLTGYKELVKELEAIINTDFIKQKRATTSSNNATDGIWGALNHFDERNKDNIEEIGKIITSTRNNIFVINNQETSDSADYVYATLTNVKSNVFRSEIRYFSDFVIKKMKPNDLIILMIQGSETEQILGMYERMANVTENIIVITTSRKAKLFTKAKVKLVLDCDEHESNIFVLKILLDYLVYQIYKIFY
ncbi:hypothetical protein [[Acholeplasma] multilocale]|uniref:hypothetical protein n=1 Tax=[Acholeplasma] multilocale TaxID=264638 RepID=UPI00047CE982|nr:hypothetical protein [[Acholeplasma] multilocale]